MSAVEAQEVEWFAPVIWRLLVQSSKIHSDVSLNTILNPKVVLEDAFSMCLRASLMSVCGDVSSS